MAAYECTEAGDWGSLGDNKIRCTGASCTMAGFYTADQAGTATLLAAANCAKAMTLTYQIRPTDQRALQITFTIASKTAETDYIWITGTDAWGTTLYECIDITAGNGAYTSTQYFRTITQIDIEDVGDGSGTAAADGTVAVTQPQWGFVWETVTSGSYRIGGNLEVGDGSTSTTLTSTNEMVWFDDDKEFIVTASATFTGTGIYLRVKEETANLIMFAFNSTVTLTDSVIYLPNSSKGMSFYGDITCVDCQFIGGGNTAGNIALTHVVDTATSYTRCKFTLFDVVSLQYTPDTLIDCYFYDCRVINTYNTAMTLENLNYGSLSTGIRKNSTANDVTIRNPKTTITASDLTILGSTGKFIEEWSCDIKVVDKDGTAINGATVLCENTNDAQEFSVDTGADGKIATQYITAKDWATTSETETDYNNFKFTISEPGYETLILENITIDSPIDWHLELQDPAPSPVYPHTSDVRQGVRYGEDSARIGVLTTGGGDIKKEVDPMREEDLIMSMINMFLQDK
jgi:hypothetical protein